MRSDIATDWLTNLSENKDDHKGMLKQYQQTAESGNQTSLVSSTSAVDKEPNETVNDTGIGAIANAEEIVEFSSRHSATHGSQKEPSIDSSRSPRRRQIDEMEVEILRSKKETEQQLRKRQFELEQEREEVGLRQREEQQEQELRLKLKQQEDELHLRQHK